MQILPTVSVFKPRVSISNVSAKHIPANISITYTPIPNRDKIVLENIRASVNNYNYLVTGLDFVEGILKTDNKDIKPYYPIYIYSTSTGVLLKKSFTDASGYYRFDYLRAGFSYMIVSYDRQSIKNATIIEFTLKEENT